MIELFKISFVFFAIITLTFMKVNLWISLLGTTFLFGLLFHLCLVLTKDYFHAGWKGIFSLLWIPVASLLGVALLMTYIR